MNELISAEELSSDSGIITEEEVIPFSIEIIKMTKLLITNYSREIQQSTDLELEKFEIDDDLIILQFCKNGTSVNNVIEFIEEKNEVSFCCKSEPDQINYSFPLSSFKPENLLLKIQNVAGVLVEETKKPQSQLHSKENLFSFTSLRTNEASSYFLKPSSMCFDWGPDNTLSVHTDERLCKNILKK